MTTDRRSLPIHTVTIVFISDRHRDDITARVRAASRSDAEDIAIRKAFGANAWLWQDNGIHASRSENPDDQWYAYGQIAKPAGLNQHRTLTGRVRIDIA